VLRFSPTSVAETAYHQRDRALFCRGPTPHPTHGLFCQRRKRRPHHLLHLPEIQPGMENPHPQPIYTSSLTSPHNCSHLTLPKPQSRVRPLFIKSHKNKGESKICECK